MPSSVTSYPFRTSLKKLANNIYGSSCSDDGYPPGEQGSRLELKLTPGTYVLIVGAYAMGNERVSPVTTCLSLRINNISSWWSTAFYTSSDVL